MNYTNVNHYAVLGVHPTADYDTIKRAYRKLVYKNHPNNNKSKNNNTDNEDDDDSEVTTTLLQQFRQIKESFEVLSDYNRRVLYDTYLYQECYPPFGNHSHHRGINTAHCFVQPSSRLFEQCAKQQQQHGNKRGGNGVGVGVGVGVGHCNCHQCCKASSSWYNLHARHIDYLKWNIHLLEESNIKLMNDLTYEREQSRKKMKETLLLLERTNKQQQQLQQQEQKITTTTTTKEFSQQQTTPTAAVLLSPSTKENVRSNLVGKKHFIDSRSSMIIKKHASKSRKTMTTRSGNIKANDILVRRRRPLVEVVNNTNEEEEEEEEEKEDFFEL